MVYKKDKLRSLKILFANGRMTHPFHIGGDGISIHTWMKYLYDLGVKCKTIGVIDPQNAPRSQESVFAKLNSLDVRYSWHYKDKRIKTSTNGVVSVRMNHRLEYKFPYSCCLVDRVNFKKVFEKEVVNFKPNIIISQLEFSPTVVSIAQKANIPVIFFVHDIYPENIWTFRVIDSEKDLVYIVFNSKYTSSRFKKFNSYVSSHSRVIYPPFDQSIYLTKNREEKFITIINPIWDKGGQIFEKIAKKLPEKQFLAVRVWGNPKDDGIFLGKCSNVRVLSFQNDMKKVYQQTQLLLFPSLHNEGFGRVIVEAAINGIPTIASLRGGIPEAVGDGGILIKHPENVDSWIEAITKLNDNKIYYRALSYNASLNSQKFTLKNLSGGFLSFILDLAIGKPD